MIEVAVIDKFLSALYSDAERGHMGLWCRQTKRTAWFPCDAITVAAQHAARLAQQHDVYVTTCLHDKALAEDLWRAEHLDAPGPSNTRGFNASAIGLPGARVDLDVVGPAHKETHLPLTVEEAHQFLLKAFPLRPTIVINSGHGLQAYWLFREVWYLESPQERAQAQGFLSEFLATLQLKAKAYGWIVDPTADLSRVLRPPGTVNRKLDPVPVTVLAWDDANRYNPSDLTSYFLEVPREEEAPRQRAPWMGARGAVAPVLKQCRFVQHCEQHAATLSEPQWYTLLSNLAPLDGGEAVAHELSRPYPGYSRAETEKKIVHARSASGPHTCQYIQQQLGFTGCPPGGCGVNAPAALGLAVHGKRDRAKLDAEEASAREQLNQLLHDAKTDAAKAIQAVLDNRETLDALAFLAERDRGAVESAYIQLRNAKALDREVKALDRALSARRRQRHLRLVEPGETPPVVTVRSALPDAPVSEDLVVPPGWRLDAEGISAGASDHNGGAAEVVRLIRVAPSPILISGRLKDITDDTEWLRLTWLRDDHWTSHTVPRIQIASVREILTLAGVGLPVASHTAPQLVRYLADY